MSTTVTYKDSTLTTATNQTKVLKTSGKYMEDDVTIVDVTSAQNPQEKSVAITSAGTEVVTPDVGYDALSKVTITTPSVSWGTPTNTITKDGGEYKYSRAFPDFSDGYLDEADGVYFDLDLETKSVTPTESAQTVTPTDNYSYLDSVTVSAIPSNYIGTGIPRLSQSDMTGLYDDGVYSVSVPNGYFSSSTYKNVPNASYFQPTANLDINLSAHGVAVTPIMNITSSGYILSDLYSGSNQYIFASDLVTGTMSISANGTYDVTNYASVSLSLPDGDNLEYGITDGTLPLVGVAKAGYAEI